MVSEKRWMGIMVAIFTLCLFLMNGCSEKSAQEKMAEKALKLATGKDVDVKIQGDKAQKVQIEQKGSKTEIAETTTWPPELISDVPNSLQAKSSTWSKLTRMGAYGHLMSTWPTLMVMTLRTMPAP
jgi:hypothetical protein